jgi:ABC-type lipoprotein export system ATPase subunit
MTIIYVTHDPRMAEFARRLIHIYDGKLANDDGSNPIGSLADDAADQPQKLDRINS